jgi:integrase
VTVAPMKRKAVHVAHCSTLAEAKARGRAIQTFVDLLRKSGHDRGIEKIMTTAAELDAEGMRKLRRLIDRVITGKEPPPWDLPAIHVDGVTFEEFAMKWVRGELAALHPDHVERKRSAYTDLCILRKYVFPALRSRPIAGITLADYERVMSEIPDRAGSRKLRSATRRHVAQVMRRVMQLAEYPAKLVTRNPIPANAMPRVRTEVALQYIYPDEDAALLGCTGVDDSGAPLVDLGQRVLFGFLARAGWRREEALGGRVESVEGAVEDEEQALGEVPALTWRRADVKHGVVHLDREKTGRPRPVPLDPDLVRALEAWRTLSPRNRDDDLVFVDMTGAPIDRYEAADLLRQSLLAAKVNRAELHDTSSPLRRQVRLHDLRASMVTVALANGRSEEWIRRRTGHTSSALERYRRVAGTLRELDLGDWTPLDVAIPELKAVAAAGGGFSGSSPRKPEARNREKSNDSAQSGREDSNLRPLDPQSSALTRLRYAPKPHRRGRLRPATTDAAGYSRRHNAQGLPASTDHGGYAREPMASRKRSRGLMRARAEG